MGIGGQGRRSRVNRSNADLRFRAPVANVVLNQFRYAGHVPSPGRETSGTIEFKGTGTQAQHSIKAHVSEGDLTHIVYSNGKREMIISVIGTTVRIRNRIPGVDWRKVVARTHTASLKIPESVLEESEHRQRLQAALRILKEAREARRGR